MRTKTVIFDIDGTLFDTSKGILSSVQYMIDKCNLPSPTQEELCSFVGPGIEESLARVYKYELEDSMMKNAVDAFREHYGHIGVLDAKLYDGVMEVLEELHRIYSLAVATSKRIDYTRKLLNNVGIDHIFLTVQAPEAGKRRSKEELIEECIRYTGVMAKETVMVGDTTYDAVASKSLNVPFVAVTYGFGFRPTDDLTEWNAIGVADNIDRLPGILNAYQML